MTAIRDYAIIGNCETAALIGPHGEIDWLCLPAFDSGSVFAALLDREHGGRFTFCPIEPFRVERRYQPDSAILETRFISDQGEVRLTDFFVIARSRQSRFYDFTSLHPTRKMVRLVEASPGASVAMRLKLASRPSYARQRALWQKRSDGGFDSEHTSVFANFPIELQGDDLLADIVVSHDTPLHVVLDYGDAPTPPDLSAIREWLRVTIAFWREWNLFNYYRGPHQAMVRRSAITLKLLTYAATGGFVAAPTTSLPEKEGGELNWDYRYTWLRDTAIFIQTLFGLGYSGEARAFLDFVVKKWMEQNEGDKATSDLSSIDVLYPIDGQPVAEESTLPHLSGYAHSRPVRIGNAAQDQFQLDNYGHVLQSFFFFRHTGGKISATERKMLQQLTEEVVQFWSRADNGIWEVRQTSQFTYGKIMCWLALERARVLLGDQDGQFEKLAQTIRAYILDHGLTKKGNVVLGNG